jgi:formate C-acetyltransferase
MMQTANKVNNLKSTAPLAIEPYDKEWGVGVSAITKDPSPFPRINNILRWLKERDTTANAERAIIYTEGYFKKYKDLPQILKCAMTYRDVLENVTISIWPDELIVGEIAAPAKSAPVYPEFSIDWLCDEMINAPLDQRRNDRYVIDE